jgi:signal transduction histidine kinase
VSHDLRGPIGNLSMAIGLIEQCEPRLRDSLKFNISHMARLVDDLVDLARLEHGRFDLVPSELNLSELVDSVAQQFQPQARAKEVALRFESKSNRSLVADGHRLRQVFANLVSNALKFTPSGGRIDVTVKEQNGEAVVEVQDTGRGIKDTDAPRVFARYWSKDARQAGLGLGLYIAKRIIEAHHGRIGFESHVGEGTRFYVALPIGD